MDDDLMSLRGAPGDDEGTDDWLSGFSEPSDSGPGTPASASETPDWLQELGGFEDVETETPPAAAPTRARAKPARAKPARKARTSSAGSTMFGLTAQQRMLLSIFLFLDTAVIGVLILVVIGAISF